MKALSQTTLFRRSQGRLATEVIAALLSLSLTSFSSPPAHAADGLNESGYVQYVDALLTAPMTHQMGYERYTSGMTMMDGKAYPDSLITSVINNSQPTSQYSAITFLLGGHYDRFQATIGRDDVAQASGPAYCYFEIWGDGVKLYRSRAIGSSLSEVSLSNPLAGFRKPQEIDIPVKGVQSLRLLVRYASNMTQQGRWINRAFGCVWGAARLIAAPATVADVTAPAAESPLRASLRRAALRLLQSANMPASVTPASAPSLAVTPLRVDYSLATSTIRSGESESDMRQIVAQTLYGFHHEGASVVLPVSNQTSDLLAHRLAPDSPERGDTAAVARLARENHADLVVFGAVRQKGADWLIMLQMLDTKQGKTISQVSVPIQPDTVARGATMP